MKKVLEARQAAVEEVVVDQVVEHREGPGGVEAEGPQVYTAAEAVEKRDGGEEVERPELARYRSWARSRDPGLTATGRAGLREAGIEVEEGPQLPRPGGARAVGDVLPWYPLKR